MGVYVVTCPLPCRGLGGTAGLRLQYVRRAGVPGRIHHYPGSETARRDPSPTQVGWRSLALLGVVLEFMRPQNKTKPLCKLRILYCSGHRDIHYTSTFTPCRLVMMCGYLGFIDSEAPACYRAYDGAGTAQGCLASAGCGAYCGLQQGQSP